MATLPVAFTSSKNSLVMSEAQAGCHFRKSRMHYSSIPFRICDLALSMFIFAAFNDNAAKAGKKLLSLL